MARGHDHCYGRTVFAVEGSGDFPWDMLRYDSAVFESQDDASKAMLEHEYRTVRVARFYPAGGPEVPTFDRWRSFGWKVCGLSQIASGD